MVCASLTDDDQTLQLRMPADLITLAGCLSPQHQNRMARFKTQSGTINWPVVLLCLLGGMIMFSGPASAQRPPTVEEYVAHVGNAKIVAPGKLVLDGYRLTCGRRPTVLDPNLDDYGAAYPGFLILNPEFIDKVPTAVKLWIYSHECGHQFRGPDEEVADCFAVQRGRRQRWLTTDGLEQICKFISPAKGSSMHLPGHQRCKLMRQCFASKKVY